MKSRLRLKTTLIMCFILVAALPFMVNSFWLVHQLSSNIEEEASKKNSLLAESVARELDDFLEMPVRHIEQIARMIDQGIIPTDNVDKVLELFVRNDEFFNMLEIIDSRGIIIKGFPYDGNSVGLDVSNQDFFIRTSNDKKIYWSTVFISLNTNTPTLTLSLPFSQGILLGHIDLSALAEITDKFMIGSGGYAQITDSVGNVIAHPDRKLILERFNSGHLYPIQQGIAGRPGIYQYTLNHVEMIASVVISSKNGWIISFSQPLADIHAPTQAIKVTVFGGLLIAVLVAIVIAVICLRMLLTPLSSLVEETKTISEGRHGSRFQGGYYYELEQLASALNTMVDIIFQREKALHNEVTVRTKAEQELKSNQDRLQSLLMLHEKETSSEKVILEYALEEAVRLTESKCGYFHFVDDDENSISLHIWSKETMKMCTAKKMSHYPVVSAGIWADSLRLREPVIHNDYQDAPNKKGYPKGHFPLLRHMSIPVFEEEKVVALIGVGNKERPYDEADQRQLQLFFATTWSIIKQKRFEEENKKINLQLQQAYKMEAIGTLAGGIAHDFNNILGIILGYGGMAKDDAPPDSQISKDLDQVLAAAHRATDLVKQILAFSRQAANEKISLKIQPLVKESLKMLRASIPTTISITEDIDPQCGTVLADPTQIHQIVMNLCTNAAHAMEEKGGELSLKIQPTSIDTAEAKAKHIAPGEYVEFTVSDTGTGIGPDIIEKIFDPFFTTKEVGKGTGMGLSIIHGIIKNCGGAITVESVLNRGTAFHVYFPVIQEQAKESEEALEAPTGKGRILYVDDEELLMQIGHDMLERLGYTVTGRRSSLEALQIFMNEPHLFDLVITDQTMPEMTGVDLARRMLQIRPDIPIILCTGYSNLVNEESAKVIGIKGFALKPITKSSIGQLIKKVLDGETVSSA